MRANWRPNRVLEIVSTTRSDRLRNLRALDDCVLAAGAVDVATGRVVLRERELELPGACPLVFERYYSSAWSHRDSVLGNGWSHSLDQAVWIEPGHMLCRVGDGREIEIDLSGLKGGVLHRGAVGRREVRQGPAAEVLDASEGES